MHTEFRWFVALVMFIVTASTSLLLIAPVTVVGSIAQASGMAPPTIITIAMSTFNLFIVAAVMLGGMLVDKFGVNKIYIGGLLLAIIGNMVGLMAGNSPVGLFVSRALQGLGTGPIMVSVAVLSHQWFKENEHGIVAGLQGMAVSVGIAAGFLLVPRLVEASGGNWAQSYLTLSAINALGIALTVAVILGPKPSAAQHVGAAPDADAPPPEKFKMLQPLVVLGGLCFFGGTWLQQSVNSIGSSFIGDELHMGQLAGADLMFYYAIAFAIGSPISGFISGMLLKGKKDNLVLAAAFAVSAVFSYLIVHWTDTAGLIACLIVLGVFQSFVNPVVMSFITKSYPPQIIGRVAGFSMTFSFVAGILSPIACSWIYNLTKTYSASFLFMVGVSIVGILLGLKLKKAA